MEKFKVQRIYVRIANARRDYLHKISTAISKKHAIVYRRLTGNSHVAGRGDPDWLCVVARGQSGGLNKSILHQGWFEFRRQLEYKSRWNGGRLVAISPRNTSITCPNCRRAAKENRRSQAQFECGRCGFHENSDRVGAMNILRAGHARLACAETSPAFEAMGQEPTDAFSQDC